MLKANNKDFKNNMIYKGSNKKLFFNDKTV